MLIFRKSLVTKLAIAAFVLVLSAYLFTYHSDKIQKHYDNVRRAGLSWNDEDRYTDSYLKQLKLASHDKTGKHTSSEFKKVKEEVDYTNYNYDNGYGNDLKELELQDSKDDSIDESSKDSTDESTDESTHESTDESTHDSKHESTHESNDESAHDLTHESLEDIAEESSHESSKDSAEESEN
ncbi:hypothetical protein C6P40_000399 [Pichia californica]|uniref:Uncharacterized protein n=1 Tax=Pichia californica TaxID=460514 RepID=A0A9P6WKM0_9ASCO|nr:hypothetical protein C6P42_003356 [[Candida] californica]KAG0688866.1 hypothetical protein C6P40_000399 [[Candida] californica]